MNLSVHTEHADDPVDAACRIARTLLAEKPPLPGQPVFLKPNIVNSSPPPVTTDYRVVQGVAAALGEAGYRKLILAEGSGTGSTLHNLQVLGYGSLDMEKVDLDSLATSSHPIPGGEIWDRVDLPDLLWNAFIVSIPVLKEHSMVGVTISLKNMIGVLPASKYGGYWSYKKSQIHRVDAHTCIADLARVLKPAWAIVDATVGMKDSHIHGSPCSPPLNLVFGSSDPLLADQYGCSRLGRDWTTIPYLRKIATFWKREGSEP